MFHAVSEPDGTILVQGTQTNFEFVNGHIEFSTYRNTPDEWLRDREGQEGMPSQYSITDGDMPVGVHLALQRLLKTDPRVRVNYGKPVVGGNGKQG